MLRLTSKVAGAALICSVLMPVAIVVPITAAQAESPSQSQCEAMGGSFSRDGGQVSCTFTSTSNVGNSPNSQTVTVTDTSSSNGTLNNDPKHQASSTCDGTGNTASPQDHC